MATKRYIMSPQQEQRIRVAIETTGLSPTQLHQERFRAVPLYLVQAIGKTTKRPTVAPNRHIRKPRS